MAALGACPYCGQKVNPKHHDALLRKGVHAAHALLTRDHGRSAELLDLMNLLQTHRHVLRAGSMKFTSSVLTPLDLPREML